MAGPGGPRPDLVAAHLLRPDPGADAVPGLRGTFDLATLDIGALEGLYERAWDEAGGKVTGTSLSVTPPKESGDSWVTIYVDHPDDTFFAVEGGLDGTQVGAHLVD